MTGHIPDGLTRAQRRQFTREQNAFVQTLPKELTEIPAAEIPQVTGAPLRAWRSRFYLVQLYEDAGYLRLSICRTALMKDGRFDDGLDWDELQGLKAEVGYGEWCAVEIYPPDKDLINVANMRHLWLLAKPPAFMWRAGNGGTG